MFRLRYWFDQKTGIMFDLDLIKKLELYVTVVSILLNIRLRHTQISVPKIGILMSKTACISPWLSR